MSELLDALATRHSQYALAGTSKLTDDQIVDLVKQTTLLVPSPFNSQSQRVVLLFGEDHDRLWNEIVKDALRKVATSEEGFAKTEEKLASFGAAHGTILFFDETATTNGLAKQFPTYAETFPVWAQQANGMLQLAVWTALAEAGLGASLQHYNPLIDDGVHSAFSLPESWKLIAQMPYGDVVTPAEPKEKADVDERVKVLGL